MTAKQIRFFGTKRQKAALKASRKRKSSAKSHRPRTNPTRTKKRAVARHTPAPKKRKKSSARRKTRRNPVPQIVSWVASGNPAERKRGKKAMAKKHKKRAVARHHSNAGRRHKSTTTRRHRRRNPGGLGAPMDWVQGGAGVLAGVIGTRAIPQMLLGAGNSGAMGYAANAVTALGLGWAAHMFLKKPIITTAVIAGGFASLMSRVIADKTPYGAQFSLSGLGDWSGLGLYQKSNFPYPPRVQNGRGPGTSMFTWGDGSQGLPAASMAAGGSDSTSAC